MKACDAVQELLAAHALGALGEGEVALVDEHLATCLVCQGAQVLAHDSLDALAAPAVEPPPHVWSGIQAKLAHRRAGDEPVQVAPTAVVSVACSFCRGGLLRPEAVYCASCLSAHHPDCFEDHGRCSVMGCGETRVVRPADLPPLEDVMEARRRYRASRRARRGWLLGGFAVLASGGLAAFSGIDLAPEPAQALASATPTAAAPRDASADLPIARSLPPAALEAVEAPTRPEAVRHRAFFRTFSLNEVVDALREETGVQVLLPPSLRDVLVDDMSWERATWPEMLEDLAAELGLGLEMRPADGVAVLLPAEGREHRRLSRDGQVTVPLHWWWDGEVPRGLGHDLNGTRVHAVAGEALAIGAGRSLVRYAAGALAPSAVVEVPGTVRGLAWSPDGARLACLFGPLADPQVGVLATDETGFAWVAQGRVPRAGDLAWLGPRELVLSHGDGIDEVVFEAGEVATRPTRALPWQAVQAPDGGLWIERPDGAERWPALGAPRAVELGPAGFRVIPTHGGAPLCDWIPTPAGWPADSRDWPLALDRSGRFLAWVLDGEHWTVLDVQRGERVTRALTILDDPAWPGLRWAADRSDLVVWRGDRAQVHAVTAGDLAPQVRVERDHTLADLEPFAWAKIHPVDPEKGVAVGAPRFAGRLDGALWCGGQLLFVSRELQRRFGMGAVAPVDVDVERDPFAAPASPGDAELDLSDRDLGAMWRPRDLTDQAVEAPRPPVPFPGEGRPASEGRPAAGDADARPAPTPAPVTPAPATPAPVDTGRVDLGHVQAGQRWVFSHGTGGIEEVWTVEAVGIDEVHVVRGFRLDGRAFGAGERHTWQPREHEGARALARGAAQGSESTETLSIPGLGDLPCAVVRVEGVTTWRALAGDAVTFPGAVREVRDGAEQRRLVRVE